MGFYLLSLPCSLFPVPCSLFPKTQRFVPHLIKNRYSNRVHLTLASLFLV
ncbi:hypothetical protein [Moorena producens]